MQNTNQISIENPRIDNLYDELSYAISHTSKGQMKEWGKGSAKLFTHLAIRRGKGLIKGIGALLKFSTYETLSFFDAVIKYNTIDHISNRSNAAYTNIKSKSNKLYQTFKIVASSLRTNPKEVAPQILLGFIGFLVGSGGLDGDGGICDSDLYFGIGNHRSIFTHSIIPALAVETIAFSLVSLVNTVHGNLPSSHDSFWDKLVANNKKLATAFAGGTCAGIAYHLLVDMNPTADRIKPYSDLPFSTTMGGHQAIFGINAATEIIDLKKKNSQ